MMMSIARTLALVTVSLTAGRVPGQAQVAGGELFPVPPPLKTGYLKVSDVHEIFYSLHGNPVGKPDRSEKGPKRRAFTPG